jgi:hypothetical protein
VVCEHVCDHNVLSRGPVPGLYRCDGCDKVFKARARRG